MWRTGVNVVEAVVVDLSRGAGRHCQSRAIWALVSGECVVPDGLPKNSRRQKRERRAIVQKARHKKGRGERKRMKKLTAMERQSAEIMLICAVVASVRSNNCAHSMTAGRLKERGRKKKKAREVEREKTHIPLQGGVLGVRD